MSAEIPDFSDDEPEDFFIETGEIWDEPVEGPFAIDTGAQTESLPLPIVEELNASHSRPTLYD